MINTCMVLFLLVHLSLENLWLHYRHVFLFLSLYIYHFHHKWFHYQILFLLVFQLFSIFDWTFFNNLWSLILKNIVLLPSKFLTYPSICGSFMHNGMIASSSLYPIKYLKVFLDPYGSYLETNILLASMLSIFNTFLFL